MVSLPSRLLRVAAAAGVTGAVVVGAVPTAHWAAGLSSSSAPAQGRRTAAGQVISIDLATPSPSPSTSPSASPSPSTPPTRPYAFTIASFNVLGSNHTKPGADADTFAPGRVRSVWAASLLARNDVGIAGFQEIQADQLDTLLAEAGHGYGVYPGSALDARALPQSLVWRTADWTPTWKGHVDITFVGQTRSQPVVRLRNNATDREIYVMNVHNSPNDSSPGGREAERDSAEVTEIKTLKTLTATGLPVFFVGDMNEHEEIFCKITGQTSLVAAQPGGSNTAGTCTPPASMRVDWIFGSQAQGARFTSFAFDRSPLERAASDHALALAHVTVP